jgi:cytochrome c553
MNGRQRRRRAPNWPGQGGFANRRRMNRRETIACAAGPANPRPLRAMARLLAASAIVAIGVAPPVPAAEAPEWAFPVDPPEPDSPPDGGTLYRLPGSEAAFTAAQLDDLFAAPDWYPDDHPAMPPLVARGVKPAVFACGYCHLPNGSGRPENAGLAGLPAAYIIRQVQDFASGRRRGAVPDRIPSRLMAELAVPAATDPGLAEAAAYFAALRPRSTIRIVETMTVPQTVVAGWVLKRSDSGGTEPIGMRIVETPDDFARFEARDERLGYTAYVPPGSLRRGQELARTGGGGVTVRCTSCHGADLRGAGTAPPIAGRSPSYLARQLYDIRSGARSGGAAAPMKPVVARLTDADVVALTAYLAAQPP